MIESAISVLLYVMAAAGALNHWRWRAVPPDHLVGFVVIRVDDHNAGVCVGPRGRTGQEGEVEDFCFPGSFSVLGGKTAPHPFFYFYGSDLSSLVRLPFDARLLAVHRDQEIQSVQADEDFGSLGFCLVVEQNARVVTIIH